MTVSKVWLVGLPGVGKTSVGRASAQVLGWRFVDLDEEIASREAKAIPEIFAEGGEEAFRVAEVAALEAVAASDEAAVVALGGGAVVTRRCRDILASGGVAVWLEAPLVELVARLGSAQGRPLLAGDPATALLAMAQERMVLYEEVADLRVDTSGKETAEVAAEVAAGAVTNGAGRG